MNSKKIIALVFSLVAIVSVNAAETAASIIKDAAAKITLAKTLTADFTVSGPENSVSGDLSMKGSNFIFAAGSNIIVYNGKTQWSIDGTLKEVSIYEPTAEEISQINPFEVIKSAQNDFSPRLLSSSAAEKKILLTPKSAGSSFKSITLTIDAKTKLPTAIALTLSDGNVINISISNIKLGINIADSKFVVNKKNYPGFDFIDLR